MTKTFKANQKPRKGQPCFMVLDCDNDPRAVAGRFTWDDREECLQAVRDYAYGQYLPWMVVEVTKIAGVYLDTFNGRIKTVEV